MKSITESLESKLSGLSVNTWVDPDGNRVEQFVVLDEYVEVVPTTVNNRPRAFTTDEVRNQFIDKVWQNIDYWHNQHPKKSKFDAMTGCMFSTLVMLDGGNMNIPGFQVIPFTAAEDKVYHINYGENYYEPVEHSDSDIAGSLHEIMHKHMPEHLKQYDGM